MKREVEIDAGSGFCFGVVNAIKKAEEELKKGETLYCLGDIVHNNMEVERLEGLGLKTISHDDLEDLKGAKVLFRAHGEPPKTYRQSDDHKNQIIDATCPVVLSLQQRVYKAYEAVVSNGGTIVIYGKKGHAEVNGLVGQTKGTALVFENVSELNDQIFEFPIYVFSQTTKSKEGYRDLVLKLQSMVPDKEQVIVQDSICRQVTNRLPNIKTFAASKDVIIFVSGLKSSNGKQLYQACKQVNPSSYFVTNEKEVKTEWFEGATKVGICGATSTPRWLMEQVGAYIESL